MAVSVTPEDVLAEAKRRYHTDAMFHARVDVSVGLVVADVRERFGSGAIVQHERNDMALAAAVAMVMVDRDPITGEPQGAGENPGSPNAASEGAES